MKKERNETLKIEEVRWERHYFCCTCATYVRIYTDEAGSGWFLPERIVRIVRGNNGLTGGSSVYRANKLIGSTTRPSELIAIDCFTRMDKSRPISTFVLFPASFYQIDAWRKKRNSWLNFGISCAGVFELALRLVRVILTARNQSRANGRAAAVRYPNRKRPSWRSAHCQL